MTAKRAARAALVVTSMLGLLLLAPGAVAIASASLTITTPTAGTSSNAAPAFAGKSSDTLDPITLNVYSGVPPGTPVETPPVSMNTLAESWEATSQGLPDGQYTAVVEQASNAPASVTFTVDTTRPVVTIVQPVTPTSNPTPTLTGAAGTQPGDSATVTVTIYEGGEVGGTQVATAAVPASEGGWTYPAPHLTDGTYTARAVQQDEAGNTGSSEAVTFRVDTTAPTVTIQQPTTPTSNPTPTLTGSGGEARGDGEVQVTIYTSERIVEETARTGVSGSEWSYTPERSLPDGTYTAQAVQEDTAGNVGRSTEVTFTVNTHAPAVTIARLPTPSNDAAPTLSGTAAMPPLAGPSVRVTIYEGSSIEDSVVETKTVAVSESKWSYVTAHLNDGVYTAQVVQGNGAHHVGAAAVEFVIDTQPPALTLSSPSNDSVLETSRPTFSGRVGTASGDHAAVKLRIYAGASTSGSPIQAFEVAASATTWTSGGAGPTLGNGIYTVVAEQTDEAGNAGLGTATFAIVVAVPPAPTQSPSPPTASFQWFPATPHVGEPVSLVSTSNDTGSPITAFSWALASDEPLRAGEHVLTTTFQTSGAHLVRLRVTDANGLSSEVAETVTVAPTVLRLMQPFPVVRIAGSVGFTSVRITLFTVLAPIGAKISVVCHGRGCPPHSQSFLVARSAKVHGATRLIALGRFERSLSAGAVLELRVSQAGEIGKYTRFTVRRGRLPVRFDTCLGLSGAKPMTCPST